MTVLRNDLSTAEVPEAHLAESAGSGTRPSYRVGGAGVSAERRAESASSDGRPAGDRGQQCA